MRASAHRGGIVGHRACSRPARASRERAGAGGEGACSVGGPGDTTCRGIGARGACDSGHAGDGGTVSGNRGANAAVNCGCGVDLAYGVSNRDAHIVHRSDAVAVGIGVGIDHRKHHAEVGAVDIGIGQACAPGIVIGAITCIAFRGGPICTGDSLVIAHNGAGCVDEFKSRITDEWSLRAACKTTNLHLNAINGGGRERKTEVGCAQIVRCGATATCQIDRGIHVVVGIQVGRGYRPGDGAHTS